MNNKKITVIVLVVLSIGLVISALFATTYALFSVDAYGANPNTYSTGTLAIEAVSKSDTISLISALPMTDDEGIKSTPYVFTIKNTGNVAYQFDVKLLSTSSNSFSSEYIKLQIDDGEVITLSTLTDSVIKSAIVLSAGETLDISIRAWLSIDTPNTEIGKSFESKIVTDGQAIVYYETGVGDINYTGTVEAINIEETGTYKLEVWGAQGGTTTYHTGGYGGYSVGYVSLDVGDTLYVAVGGSGNVSNGTLVSGGFNGGGSALARSTAYYMASGGGATHIALSSGELSTLSNNVDDILIVAGGGGGASSYNTAGTDGGCGGGINGCGLSTSCSGCGTRTGGSQTVGGSARAGTGSFGQGFSTTSYAVGGGGGFYGGAGDTHEWGATGGSGYIGNALLTDKTMYCYNCTTSDEEATKTVSTTCVSSLPIENCAKMGFGYARITLVE